MVLIVVLIVVATFGAVLAARAVIIASGITRVPISLFRRFWSWERTTSLRQIPRKAFIQVACKAVV
jgi:hypothetical protein